MISRSAFLLPLACATLTACANGPLPPTATTTSAIYPAQTPTQSALSALLPPAKPVAVAVYGFSDLTGQFKLVDTGQSLSRAISQGGGSILVKALQDAGNHKWFTVVEREQLKDLLNERQIISEMRARYLGETTVNPAALPSLLFAGVLLEGGIVSYDTNTMTSGAGAAVLGLGVDGKYKQDTVTVYLRAVSVKTGEVLTTVTASKTITSKSVQSNLFAYVSANAIGQNELGYTTNEPSQLALQQAIEKAVYGLVMEGSELQLWSFADNTASWPARWRYQQERDGLLTPQQAMAMQAQAKVKRVKSPDSLVPPPPPPPPAAANKAQPKQASAAAVKLPSAAANSAAPNGIDDLLRLAGLSPSQSLAQPISSARPPRPAENLADQAARSDGGGSPH